MKKKVTVLALALSFFVFFLTAGLVSAQQIKVDFGEFGFKPESTTIPSFIHDFYLFAVGAAGVIAVGVIIVGGIMYSVSGAVDKKGEGKSLIMGAIWGLVLLLGAYVILKTVNPRLVELENPGGKLEEAGFETCQSIEGLRWCNPGERERNDKGECQCRIKPLNGCPISVKKKDYSYGNAPLYTWVKEYKNNPIPKTDKIFSIGEIPDISEAPGVCPDKVKIEDGVTPIFITSVGKNKEGFVINLKKQPVFSDLPFPLPPGEYYGDITSFFVTGKPDVALCVLTHIEDKNRSKVFPVFPGGLENASACATYSSSTQNNAKLQVKSGTWLEGLICPIGTHTPGCMPAYLIYHCPAFGVVDSLNASKICRMESKEDPTAVSGTDFCQNEKDKPKSERHPFSMGLFQINVIANGRLVTKETGNSSCEGLFNVPSPPQCNNAVPCKNPGGSKTGYDCGFIAGKETQWENCKQVLSDPAENIGIACEIYKQLGLKGGWTNSYNACGLGE